MIYSTNTDYELRLHKNNASRLVEGACILDVLVATVEALEADLYQPSIN
jgi:hypothetical protein